MQISPNSWFSRLMGFPESSWDFRVPSEMPGVGEFSLVSVGEMEDQLPTLSPGCIPALTVLTRDSYDRRTDLFDTSALQVRSRCRTTYQVASNFNCLELGSERTNPFNRTYLTRLMSNSTQGPSAAAGAGAGAILRLSVHRRTPLNLLDSTPIAGAVTNGKLYAQDVRTGMNVDHRDIRVGLHNDVRASFDRSESCLFYPDGPLIDQVYTSTPIFRRGAKGDPAPFLRAAYRGSYLSSVLRRSQALVLTLVGGGCFCNPPEAIAEAILDAHETIGPYLVPGCRVWLPLYDPRSGPEFWQVLERLVQKRAGGVPLKHVRVDAGYPREQGLPDY
ncbi:MAG: hypothetical protein ACYCOU_01605 [Sulfobacillus sp.]